MTILAPPTTNRLLDPGGSGTLPRHLERHGPLPIDATEEGRQHLLREIQRSGLTGRGGAGFWAFRKHSVIAAAGGHPVLVVNAMEGEPASSKDHFLLQASPHLVLDGVELLADALRVSKAVIGVPDDRDATEIVLRRALGERPASRSGREVEVMRLAARYVAGEESALVAAVAGQPGAPRHRPDKAIPLTIGRHPALVHNVETLAHIALIARYGADWFSSVGTPEAPGTTLVTISGEVERGGVVEVEIGTPIDRIVELAWPRDRPQAVLVGGYGGSWLVDGGLSTPYAPAELRELGASMGVGVLVAISAHACGIRETARIARFMAAESAGQCGPCLFGLSAIADDLNLLASGKEDFAALDRLLRRCGEVDGRGACRHPDGVVRLVRSALRAFAADFGDHARGEPCVGSTRATSLPLSGSRARKG